jgi:hypothetical protein
MCGFIKNEAKNLQQFIFLSQLVGLFIFLTLEGGLLALSLMILTAKEF